MHGGVYDVVITITNFDIDLTEAFYADTIERNPEKSMRVFQQMAKKYPKEKRVYLYLAVHYWQIRSYSEAMKKLTKALELDPYYGAALNIIATLILMVMEKTRDIGILKAMGANSKSILKIFFLQGAMIGVIGTFVGTILGLIWCWIANTFELIKVPVDIYPIAFVPFRIKILDLAMIVGVTLLISFLSTRFPSYRASKVDPVVALKYE